MITTTGSEVVCIPPHDTSHLAPCDHKEADTRMILHMADAVNKGFKRIVLHTVDTDVAVLSVAAAAAATKLHVHIEELWIAFGTGKILDTYLFMTLLKPLALEMHHVLLRLGSCDCGQAESEAVRLKLKFLVIFFEKNYIQPPVSVLLYLMLFYVLYGLVLFRKGDFRLVKCL